MGKGFNNYMCKKFFHPGSRDNLKRVWMAQQKTESEKKKQDELKAQYEKEQDLYVNKSLVSKESKEKLSVNFMYEPPPGMKKEREREDGEPEFKFEWQRKYNAPREDYCKGDEDIRDQPFGIAVRNVRCIKCHTWGHVNTDRECPLFNKARDEFDEAIASIDPSQKLMNEMKETGLAMTRSAINTLEQMQVPMQKELNKKKEEVPEEDLAFLKTLTTKDKKKLLKKLEKLENKDKEKKKKKKKEKKKKRERSPSSDSSSSSPTPSPEPREKKADKHGSKKHETRDDDRPGPSRHDDAYRSRGKRESDEDDRRRSEHRNREDSHRNQRSNEDDRNSDRRRHDDSRNRGKRSSPEPRDRRGEDSRKRTRHDSEDRSSSRRRH